MRRHALVASDFGFAQAVANARLFGNRVSHPDFDCYSQLYYSRINKFVFSKSSLLKP